VDENEKFLAAAAQYLVAAGQHEAARLLASCDLDYYYDQDSEKYIYTITLRGSAEFARKYREDVINRSQDGPFRRAIQEALEAVFPNAWNINLQVGVGVRELEENWRTLLIAEADTSVNNQNPWTKSPIVWHDMRFNSPPERAIAEALERMGVMYLPNCLVRVGNPNNQETFFPDFLICHRGKWGILEVDGQTYHSGTATQDYERMRKLIRDLNYFDRFPAKRCMEAPDQVVKEFLEILAER
jgi:hypothetical protein